MTGLRTRLRRRRSGRDDGAVLVEAAFITPVFLLLLFAIIEFGLFFKDELTAQNAVRAAARTGSAPSSEGFADFEILKTFERESEGFDKPIERLVVFNATRSTPDLSFEAEPDPACLTNPVGTGVAGKCNVYGPADVAVDKTTYENDVLFPQKNYWPGASRQYSRSAGTDYLGIHVVYLHDTVTKAFTDQVTISETVVIRLEPKVR